MVSLSLLLFLFPPVLSDLQTCEKELTEVLSRFSSIVPNDTYSEMAVYSGKWIGDLGNYFDCIAIKDANYALFTINAYGTQLAYSLCGPNNCTVEDYQQLIGDLPITTTPEIRRLGESLRQVKPGKIAQKRLKATQELGVEVVFPQHYIHEHFGTLNAGAIVMLVICVLLGVVMTAGTAIDLNRQFAVKASKKHENGDISFNKYVPMTDFADPTQSPPPPPPSIFLDFLVCFSTYTNFKRLFSSRSNEKLGTPKDTLDLLNGVRVMSIGWVVLGHVYLLRMTFGPIKNQNDLLDEFKHVKTAMIYGALFAVDTFFWLSGLLMAFLLFQQLNTSKGMQGKGWVYLYFHRLYRILPAYMFVLFMCWAFTKYMGNGPLWVYGDQVNEECHDWWWTNVLFLNNFLPDYKSSNCLGQSWYLANDMQFFWFSPPVFFLYSKVHKLLGWVLFSLGIPLAVISSAVIAHKENCNVVLVAPGSQTMNDDIYVKPYCRVGPYVIGIICGLILYTHRHHAKTGEIYDQPAFFLGNLLHNRYIRYFCYVLGLFLMNFFIFIQYSAYQDVDNGWKNWTRGETAAFYGFNRPAWGLGISLLLLPMLLGHCKLVTWFLSLDLWTPLARLTFCTYLVHIHLAIVFFESRDQAYWLNDLNLAIDFFWVAATSFAAAIPLTLAVESPFMAMEKLFKGKRR